MSWVFVEALSELACRVVHDGNFSPVGGLLKELFYQRGLPGPRVAHDLEVLRLLAQRYPHHLSKLCRLETNAVALLLLVELFGRKQLWSTQDAPIFQLLETLDVAGHGKPKHGNKADGALDKCHG